MAEYEAEPKGNRIFYTSSGFLGLGLPQMTTGDLVCVLSQCKFPVLFRKVDSHYVHVGSCFVLELMEGEVKDMLLFGELNHQEFRIRQSIPYANTLILTL